MATIRLEDVTRVFDRPPPSSDRRQRVNFGSRVDDSYAARAAARSSMEQDLTRHTGPVVALDHVTVTIPDGQTFCFLGPSGCGKTTLLRVVAGLDDEYSGTVYFDGQDMTDVPPKDRFIGMVFQNYALYPHFQGRGNLSFFFRVRHTPDEETEARIRATSEMMGIGFDELLRRKPGKLSGGQQQRVAIGRALVRKPRLFLFDEPLSNLDAKLRSQTRVEINRLLHRFQITSIYVTHDQVEAITLADQLAVMRAGRIEQVGPFRQLMDDPANAFVAGFLGTPPMNLLTGGVVADGAVRLGDVALPLPPPVQARVRAGQALIVGARPEEVRVASAEGAGAGEVRVRGSVEVIEPDFGRRTQLVYLRTGDLTFAATGELDASLNVGDTLEAVFSPDQLYFFDAESERRIR